MSQDLLERIASLERSRRRWKVWALASSGVLALVLAFGAVLGASLFQVARTAADRAEAERREAEAQRDRAEHARQEAERAQQAENKATTQAQKYMYQDSLNRAQEAFSKQLQEASKP